MWSTHSYLGNGAPWYKHWPGSIRGSIQERVKVWHKIECYKVVSFNLPAIFLLSPHGIRRTRCGLLISARVCAHGGFLRGQSVAG